MRQITNHPGYRITEDGRVWSDKSCRWLRPGVLRGYHTYKLYTKGQHNRPRLAGRLVLETYVGICPEGKECCHRNDDRQDDRLENLYWGTRSENHADAVKNDRYGSVLNRLQVRVVHHLLESGEMTQSEISRVFGLPSRSCVVNDIARGYSWSAVTGRVRV